MYNYSFRQDYLMPNRQFENHPSATGNLIKIRSLGYVSDGYLCLYNFIDVKIGQDETYAKFDLNHLPDLDFLKNDFLLLMEVLMDRFREPYAFIPLNRRFITDPDLQLKGDRLKDLAESMHDGIIEDYPFKELIIPTIVKRFDDSMNPEDLPNLCA